MGEATYRVTLCCAVKAHGHGHIRDKVARCEQSLRSRVIQEVSIRRSEMNLLVS